MKIKLLTLFVIVGAAFSACNQNEDESCLELDTTASFTVGNTAFAVTHTPVWTSSGIYQSVGFRHDLASGQQHIVSVLFEGDSVGNYSLRGTLDPHRAFYLGPAASSTLFTDPNDPGLLTVTSIDLSGGCLTGNYNFTAGGIQFTGEFQSLRPQ